MKFMLYLFGFIVIVFTIVQFMSFTSAKSVEKYTYTVIKNIENVEIREYEKALFSKTSMSDGTYREISSSGFRILAGYIFGDNADSTKIAMTSPVVMSLDTQKSMMFMIPKNMTKADLPTPNNEHIEFVELPNRKLAAITFGGYADDESIQHHQQLLDKTLKENGIKHKGNFSFFGYNPPYQVVNRRNEVVVEVEI